MNEIYVELKNKENYKNSGWIGWNRFEQRMKESGELKENECLISVRIDKQGIHFDVGRC